jgi:ABC-type nitrate/sulfonate/bicarbonate transport system substrate-binding protein
MDRLRFARYPGPSARVIFAPLLLGVRDGVFRAAGIELDVSEPPTHPWTAIADGGADLGVGYLDYWFRPELRGRFTVIGTHEAFAPGTGLTTFLARRALVDAGSLKTPADLAGRRVALLPGRGDDYMVVSGLLRAGRLSLDDVEIVQVPHHGPERAAMLERGEVDVLIGRRPTDILDSEAEGLVRWLPASAVVPGFQARFLLAAPQLITSRRDVLRRFLDAYRESTQRIQRLWSSPLDVSDLTGDSVAALAAADPPGFVADAAIDLARLADELAELRTGGLIPADDDGAGLVDLEPLAEALAVDAR